MIASATEKIQRCQKVLVKQLPSDILSYYNDIQADYAKIMQMLIGNSGIGHLIWDKERKNYHVVTPEQSAASGSALSPHLQELIKIIGEGGNKATGCYGILYSKYEANTKIKSNNIISIFFKRIATLDQEIFDKNVKTVVKKNDSLTEEDWVGYRNRLLNKEDATILWNEIQTKVGNPNKGSRIVSESKKDNAFPVPIRHADYNYCTALMSMVTSSFCSWIECSQLHETTRSKLKEQIDAVKHPELFKAFCSLSAKLDEANYGFSKKVLFQSIEMIKLNRQNDFLTFACEEIKKYPIILESDIDALHSAYRTWKAFRKLTNMKPYISMPNFAKHYQVPFGLTGKGKKFDLESDNGELTVKIDGSSFVCFKSHYFSDLTVKQKGTCFAMKFRHKVKTHNANEIYRDWIDAEVKEIKLQRAPNDKFYLYLPFAITHNSANFNAQKFFCYATAPETLEIPDSLVITAFDLNLSTPLTMSVGKIVRGASVGSLDALDYGRGDVVGEPKKIASDTNLSNNIRALSNKMRKLIGVIREYKTSIKTNSKVLEKETQEWLTKEVGGKEDNIRHQIQTLLASYNAEFRQFKKRCRDTGHNTLSESIQLLRLMDSHHSLKNSYDNMHILSGSYSRAMPKDDIRANFREFVSKQYAAIIVKSSKEVGANVVFMEDLDLDFDSDNDTNSISRLFAAGQLKKRIEDACHKAGIGCVFVNPALTSRTDPVTGELGYRRKKFDKENLYVMREGVLGKMNSDVAASLNVLLVGLNHSVFPRRLMVKMGKVSNGEEGKKVPSKRVTRFLLERKVKKFFVTKEGTINNDNGEPFTGFVYVSPEGYISEDCKKGREKEMDSKVTYLQSIHHKIPDLPVTCLPGRSYKGFRVKKVLEET